MIEVRKRINEKLNHCLLRMVLPASEPKSNKITQRCLFSSFYWWFLLHHSIVSCKHKLYAYHYCVVHFLLAVVLIHYGCIRWRKADYSSALLFVYKLFSAKWSKYSDTIFRIVFLRRQRILTQFFISAGIVVEKRDFYTQSQSKYRILMTLH